MNMLYICTDLSEIINVNLVVAVFGADIRRLFVLCVPGQQILRRHLIVLILIDVLDSFFPNHMLPKVVLSSLSYNLQNLESTNTLVHDRVLTMFYLVDVFFVLLVCVAFVILVHLVVVVVVLIVDVVFVDLVVF